MYVKGAKVFSSLFAICLIISLVGCTGNPAAQNFTNFMEKYDIYNKVGGDISANEPAEIRRYQDGNFTEVLGFDIKTYPDDETYKPARFYIINWFGQIEYFFDNDSRIVLRAAEEWKHDLKLVYNEEHNLNSVLHEINGVNILYAESKLGCKLISWHKDGYQYSLHATEKHEVPLNEIEIFVEETSCG